YPLSTLTVSAVDLSPAISLSLTAPCCHSYAARPLPDLPSFPTRRSSDLGASHFGRGKPGGNHELGRRSRLLCPPGSGRQHGRRRSEEHTSELQSRFDLVCRLLLEKKKEDC